MKKSLIFVLIIALLFSGKVLYGSVNNTTDKILLIDSNIEIKNSSIEIGKVNFMVSAARILIENKKVLDLTNITLNIEDFKGYFQIQDAKVILEGSFSKLYNNDFELNSMKNVKITIYNGIIESQNLYIPYLEATTKGNLVIDNEKVVLDVENENLILNGFHGKFVFSNYLNMLNISGKFENLKIKNDGYNVLIS